MTDWTVLEPVNPHAAPCWGVVQQLTNLTCLTVLDANSYCDLKELQYLTKLHTLELFAHTDLATKVPHFTNLLRLELSHGQEVVYDFSCLTHLTALILTDHGIRSLVLPGGTDVGLRHLFVSWDEMHDINDTFEMRNLGLAVHLTSIHLEDAFPDNLTLHGWPQAMPYLSHVTIELLKCSPPQALLTYPRLRHLDLSLISLETLPDFFTGLTQLEHLVMSNHNFTASFPQPVLALSQLQTLDMSSTESVAMCLPENLVHCATWPNLIRLNLELNYSAKYSLDSQMVLLLLSNAIKESGSKICLIVDKLYTM